MDDLDKQYATLQLWTHTEFGDRLSRLEERHDAALKALDLQAAEYERRLDILNNAHARHDRLDLSRVTLERYVEFTDKMAKWRHNVDASISELHGQEHGKHDLRRKGRTDARRRARSKNYYSDDV